MLAKTTIVAGALLAGLVTAASAQTYEPNGTFQALWSGPAATSTTAAPAPRASRAPNARQAFAKHQSKKKPQAQQGN